MEKGNFPEFKILAFDIEYVDGEVVLISIATSENSAQVFPLEKQKGQIESLKARRN